MYGFKVTMKQWNEASKKKVIETKRPIFVMCQLKAKRNVVNQI